MPAAWLSEAAESFWLKAGGSGSLPRDIEKATVRALPLGIVALPRLWLSDFACWMRQRGLECPIEGPDRALQGCLVAYGGRGLVVLDGSDPEDERRFTVAHEVAHFILEYLEPRSRAIAALGPRVMEVLDGLRAPTVEERVHAVLASAPVGVHTHLMDRGCGGSIFQGRVLQAESRADLLALELLAPSQEIQRRIHSRTVEGTFSEHMRYAAHMFRIDFGLPKRIADGYAYQLVDSLTGGPSIKEWLGLQA